MVHTLNVFSSILIVLLALGIFIPYFNTAVGASGSSPSVTAFDNTVAGSSYSSIALNIVALPLWTFGLNTWINLILLLPLRVLGLICLYYIIFPTKS